MKIVIIEDERITAIDLQQTLKHIDPELEIISVIRSVSEGIEYFKKNTNPDIIFSDIQLGDGLSFEILKGLQIPVIFCTAYDEYALQAFTTYGIGYILKPFTEDSVRQSLQTYKNLRENTTNDLSKQYELLKQMFSETSKPKITSLLINYKDRVIPVRIIDIAMIYLKNNIVHLQTFANTTFYPNKSLDDMDLLLGDQFFRVNRQYLVNRKAVNYASSMLSRKMSLSVTIPHDDIITISREKSTQFLKWLQDSE